MSTKIRIVLKPARKKPYNFKTNITIAGKLQRFYIRVNTNDVLGRMFGARDSVELHLYNDDGKELCSQPGVARELIEYKTKRLVRSHKNNVERMLARRAEREGAK